MSKIILSYVLISLACLLTLNLFSCYDDDKLGPAPIITSFSPNSGIIGSHVTINGNHFIPPVDTVATFLTNTSIVKFNGTIAEAERVDQDSVGKQEIHTSVPAGATSGKITVTANGITAMSNKDFIVTVPIYLPNVTVSTATNFGGIDIDIDIDGSFYLADNDYYNIVKITKDGNVDTLFSLVENVRPILGIAVDDDRNVYSTVGNTIKKITPDGTVLTLAGNSSFGFADGKGAEAQFNIPFGIDVDAYRNVYVADLLNHKIRKITPDGTVTTLAGSTSGYVDGPANMAQFEGPIGVAVDSQGNVLVAESCKIRQISPDGNVTTVAGSTYGYYDGPAIEAQFNGPQSIAKDISGNMYITDQFVVRRIGPDGMVVTVAGSIPGDLDGPGASAKFCGTQGITIGASGAIYLTQGGGCGKIRKIVIY